MTTSSISPSRSVGAAKKPPSPVVSPPGACTSMKPLPAGPVSGPSVTNAVNAAASNASTALPPSRRTRAPASEVSGWPAAIAPRIAAGYFGSTSTELAGCALFGAQEGRQLVIARGRRVRRRLESCASSAPSSSAEPRRDDRDPHLAGQPRIHRCSEDDVRLVRRGLADDLSRIVDLDEREVVAAGDREQDA